MKFILALLLSISVAFPIYSGYLLCSFVFFFFSLLIPSAAPGDARSPCPGLNALANMGFLNRNGRNLRADDIVTAAKNAFNLSPDITNFAITNAQKVAGLFPNGVMSSLEALNLTHNVVEHDASLSRNDKYLGDFIRPNPALIKQFVPNLNANLTRSDIAAFRRARINDSRARNPTFTWGITAQEPVAAGESTFIHTILGNDGVIPAKFINYFLTYEQLPVSLGWTRPAEEISMTRFLALVSYYTLNELMARDETLSMEAAEILTRKLVKQTYGREK